MSTRIKKLLARTLDGKSRTVHRAAGDRARDRKDWSIAEKEFKAHLDAHPTDQAIWIQYGHCLKEQGKFELAEEAYRRGIQLLPEDADAHLQLGHVLKIQGRTREAGEAYQTSLDLQPTKAAYDEVVGFGGLDEVAVSTVVDNADTIYLEIDDLLDYLRNHKTLSGIQRVQVGIIQHACRAIDTDNEPYAFIRTGKNAVGFWRVEPSRLTTIIDYINQSSVNQAQLLSLIESAEQHAVLVEPTAGQTYFVLGAFWGFGANAARYTRLKTASVSVGVYIYDLIPITHPEYCAAGLVSEFSFALGDGLNAFDYILTISEFVAEDVRRFQKKHKLKPVPVEAVLLAHQLNDRPPIPRGTRWTGPLMAFENRDFVLMVSTIEARKNHSYLYSVWKAMLDEGLDPPDLVFVGRFGWRVNDLRDMLEGTAYLNHRVHVLHDLSDVELEALYQKCMFTAFPSIVEGWGLPVGESLAHGRPCVASNTSSIPEVGGSLVDYIDPWNIRDGIKVFKKMIFDASYRNKRAEEIQKNFVGRTWDKVGDDLLSKLRRFSKVASDPYLPPLLAAGELLVPGDLSVGRIAPSNYAARPLRPIFAESWYPAEPLGCWMRGQDGFLWFSSRCAPGSQVTVYMHMIAPPWATAHQLSVRIGKHAAPIGHSKSFPETVRQGSEVTAVSTRSGFLTRASGTVDADGTVYIKLLVEGPMVDRHPGKSEHDERQFYVGLVKLAYAMGDDARLRMDLMERFSTLT